MKKVGVIVAGVVVLGVAASVPGAAFIAGKRVESAHKDLQEFLQSKRMIVRIIDSKYDRGLFSANSTMTVRIGCDPAADGKKTGVDITVKEAVRHGPLLPGGHFGAALIETTLVIPPDAAKELSELYGNKPPLTIKTLVGFNGSAKTTVDSPSFSHTAKDGTLVIWGGISGESLSHGPGGKASGKVSMPNLQVQNAREQIAINLKGVEFTTEGVRAQGSGLAGMMMQSAHGEGQIALIEFSGKDKMPPVKFEKVSLTTDQKTDEKGLLQSAVKFGGSGTIGQDQVAFELAESVKRLHVSSYLALMMQMYSTDNVCPGPDGAMPNTEAPLDDPKNKDIIAEILRHDPEYGVDKFSLTLDGKRGEFGIMAGTKGVTAADKEKPLSVVVQERLHVTSFTKLPTGWVQFFVKKFASSEEEAASTTAMVNLFLDNWTQQGYIKREGEFVSANFEMKGPTMTLNGKPFSPAALMGGGAMPAPDAPAAEMAEPAPQ